MLKKLRQLLFAHNCITNNCSHYKTVDCYKCPYANVVDNGADIKGCNKDEFNKDLKTVLKVLISSCEVCNIV